MAKKKGKSKAKGSGDNGRATEVTPQIAAARAVADHWAALQPELAASLLPASMNLTLKCMPVDALGGELFRWAFATMKENMEALYEQSSVGWLEKSKRKEMKTDGMHYLVAFESTTNEPLGFTAFLFDVENDEEVGYCYEMHLASAAQRRGVGSVLMKALIAITAAAKMRKVMLTCFVHNVAGQQFFRKKHSFTVDDFTPDDVDYTILSLSVGESGV